MANGVAVKKCRGVSLASLSSMYFLKLNDCVNILFYTNKKE